MTVVEDKTTGQKLVRVKPRKKKKIEQIDGPEESTDLAADGAPKPKALSREDADKLRQDLRDHCSQMETATFTLAQLIYEVYESAAYLDWEGPIHDKVSKKVSTRLYKTFEEYVENELSIGKRKSDYLKSIYEWFVVDMNDPSVQKKVEKLGWTKIAALVGVATLENIDHWVERARELTVSQLQAECKEALHGNDPSEAQEVKRRSFALMGEQIQAVDEAFEHAATVADSDKPGHLLTLICMDYMSGAVRPNSKSKKTAYLRHMEKLLNVKLVAVDPESKQVIHGKSTLNFLDGKDGDIVEGVSEDEDGDQS